MQDFKIILFHIIQINESTVHCNFNEIVWVVMKQWRVVASVFVCLYSLSIFLPPLPCPLGQLPRVHESYHLFAHEACQIEHKYNESPRTACLTQFVGTLKQILKCDTQYQYLSDECRALAYPFLADWLDIEQQPYHYMASVASYLIAYDPSSYAPQLPRNITDIEQILCLGQSMTQRTDWQLTSWNSLTFGPLVSRYSIAAPK